MSASWRSLGPYGGSAEIVRTAPDIRNLVLAATSNALLFRSDNGGASWSGVPFSAQSAGVVHALEIDPRSGNTWYVGMEGNSRFASGVYRTSDAGKTWTLLPATRGIAIWSLAFYPGDPAVMAAGAGSGVYLTRDAGATWNLISPPDNPELQPVVSLAFDPHDSNVLYAGTTHLPWRTTDGGKTWESIHGGMIDDSDVFSIQADPAKPGRVLASACSGAYMSEDRGGRWMRLNTPKGAFRTYFISLDPTRPGTVFAGTSDGLLKSSNGGAAWRIVTRIPIRSIAFDGFVPGRIFFASSTDGLLLSTDGGESLRQSNFGFTNRAFTGVTGSENFLYVSGPAGLYRTDNLGLRWDAVGRGPGGELTVIAAAPYAPKTLFAGTYQGVFESADFGKTWRALPGLPEGARVRSLAASPHRVLLAGTDRGVFRHSADRWSRVSSAAVGEIHAGSRYITAFGTGAAMVSSDEGLTWRQCAPPSPGISWYGLAFDPADANTALAATSRGVFRSVDGCASWTEVAGGLERATAEAILFHPTHTGEAFVAQAGNVFHSTDHGQTWLPLDSGAMALWPSTLFVSASAPDRLFALVPGRGVFSTTTSALPAIIQRSLHPIQSSGRNDQNAALTAAP